VKPIAGFTFNQVPLLLCLFSLLQFALFGDKEILISTRRIPTMMFEGLLVIVGTFVVLAFLFWKAAERPPRESRDERASHSSELHKV
jgi:hypothetical protein